MGGEWEGRERKEGREGRGWKEVEGGGGEKEGRESGEDFFNTDYE